MVSVVAVVTLASSCLCVLQAFWFWCEGRRSFFLLPRKCSVCCFQLMFLLAAAPAAPAAASDCCRHHCHVMLPTKTGRLEYR